MTQAILLGAGQGSRLDAERGTGPKWMLEVEGQSLAQHLVNMLHANDITEILLVRGAIGGSVLTPSVAYADIIRSHNMLHTLSQVRDYVRDDVVVVYCDLLLEPRVVQALLAYNGEAGVVVDRRWQSLFSLRDDNPLAIAESCRVDDGRLLEIGQPVKAGTIPDAQYIGLMRFGRSMFHNLMKLYDELEIRNVGRPWRNAPSFQAAFFTDFLQEAIDCQFPIDAVTIDGGWLEFDTPRDLAIARRLPLNPNAEVFNLAVLPDAPSVLSAGGVAVRGEGAHAEVLLVGTGMHGGWRIPKGMLEPGERVEDAACREVLEETGLPVRIVSPAEPAEWTYEYGGRKWRERCYFFRMSSETELSPKPDAEHEVAAWVRASEALDSMRFAEEQLALRRILSWP
jgi:choline kinase/ADP-ribose pyrophosphatase YjhB (NUDIX family)